MIIPDYSIISLLDCPNGETSEIFTELILPIKESITDEKGYTIEYRNLEEENVFSNWSSELMENSFSSFYYYCEECKKENGFICSDYKKISENICVLTFTDSYKHNIRVVFSVETVKTKEVITSKLVKIAQYPIKDFKIGNGKKYKKELKSDQYEDYINAHKANYNNLNIASFVYLRRVFESLVFEADDEKDKIEPIDVRIKRLVKNGNLNELFIDQGFNSVYSILSKHIHELTEEEAANAYKTMLLAVNRIIDEHISHKDKERKDIELKNALSNIATDISSGKNK